MTNWNLLTTAECFNSLQFWHLSCYIENKVVDQFTRSYVRINLPLFSTVVPAVIFVVLSCRPFVAITTLSTGFVGVEVTSVCIDHMFLTLDEHQ